MGTTGLGTLPTVQCARSLVDFTMKKLYTDESFFVFQVTLFTNGAGIGPNTDESLFVFPGHLL
jgi:hypothetical protein